MATPFSRTTRSLNADSFRRSRLAILIVMLVLGGWVSWLLVARVTLYEVTDAARLEVDSAVQPIESPVSGRVVRTHLTMGNEVKPGDLLVELDSGAERLRLVEEQARLASLAAQLAAMRDRDAAEHQAQVETERGSPVALDESRAKYEEADTVARSAEEDVKRLQRLHASGVIAEIELIRARAEAGKRRAAADALRIGVDRLDKDQRAKMSERWAGIESLKAEMAALEGKINESRAGLERLKYEIERRQIRATASGKLGEVAELRIGSVVREGDKLGAIVPSGALRVVAEFAPSAALGRVKPGQPARLRLAGFPWTEYGSLSATVTSVASEPRGGRVRVELLISNEAASIIPLQHGLPTTVEVEVDRVSPAALILRAAGKRLSSFTGIIR
jgi:membrane fusion protein (multidrug efflux system)